MIFAMQLLTVLFSFILSLLQKILNGSLIFSRQLRDMLNSSSIFDQQFKQMFEKNLQNVQIVIFDHPEHILSRNLLDLLSLVGKGILYSIPERCKIANSHLDKTTARIHISALV